MEDEELKTELDSCCADARFQALLLDQLNDMVVATDLNGTINYVNAAVCRKLGREKQALLGQQHVTVFGEDRLQEVTHQEIIDTVLAEGAWEGEVLNHDGDGNELFLRSRVKVLCGEDGKPIGMLGVSSDITRQKLIAKERNTLAQILVNVNDIAVIKNLDLQVIAANQPYVDATGCSSLDEVIGRTEAEIYGIPDDQEPVSRFMQDDRNAKALPAGECLYREEFITFRDGRKRHFLTSKFPVYDEYERLIAIGHLSTDITELRKTTEQLFSAEKKIALATLSTGIAHEINNPNSIIMINAHSLLTMWNEISPVLEEFCQKNGIEKLGNYRLASVMTRFPAMLDAFKDCSERIKHIVDNLGDFIQESSTDEKKRIDINEVLNKAVSLVKHIIFRSTRHFSVQLSDEIPTLPGHFQKLVQVFANLIMNACESLDSKEQAVTIVSSPDHDCRQAIVQIIDEGKGIEKDKLSHVKDPFNTSKLSEGKIGLGLSVCDSIVADHGGSIDIESNVGEGSVITVRIPL